MQRLSFPPCSATRSTKHSLEAPPTAALSFRRAVEEGSRTGDGGGAVRNERRGGSGDVITDGGLQSARTDRVEKPRLQSDCGGGGGGRSRFLGTM